MTDSNEDKVMATEIDDVLAGVGIAPVTETQNETPPAETPAGETPPVEVAPEVPPVEDKPPIEGEPPVETPPAAPPVDAAPVTQETDLDRLKRENEELRQTLLEAARTATAPKVAPVKTPEEEEAAKAAATARGPIVLPFFKEDKDIDEAFKDVDSANKFMTRVVATAVEFVAKNMPAAVERISDQQLNTRLAVKEFYDNNKDLLPYKEYCGYITNKLVAENPNLTLGELFEKVAVESRKALKLADAAGDPIIPDGNAQVNTGGAVNPPAGSRGAGPALPPAGGGGRRGGPPLLSGVEKEINDLIS